MLVPRDTDEYKKIHDTLCDREEWIIDGMNLRFLEYRVQRAEVILFLDIPRYICFWRIFKRTVQYYGKETPSSADGCYERFNWEFLKFLKWVWNFKKRYSAKIREIFKQYSEKQIYILKSHQEIDAFVKNLKL